MGALRRFQPPLLLWLLTCLWLNILAQDSDQYDLEESDDPISEVPVSDSEHILQTSIAKVQTRYSPPTTNHFKFIEMFDDDQVFQRWAVSTHEKFRGQWTQSARKLDVLDGDMGLKLMDRSHYHGISTSLGSKAFHENKNSPLAVFYEVLFEEEIECGGAYLKLFNSQELKEPKVFESFDHLTPYVVMFGPDVCGSTNKVHLIIKAKNPVKDDWLEFQLQKSPTVPRDRLSHTYGFRILPDNTYEIYVDGSLSISGSMFDDFEPSFTAEDMIVDVNDTKPEDWVDEQIIPDPNAKKPDDWNSDEPITIPDHNAVKPEDWLENEPPTLVDETSTRPEDWDESSMGKWKPKQIPNPKCAGVSGCGPWNPPMKANPAFKGKWKAPLIPNPNYKGEWKPRMIKNPDFYKIEQPHALASFDGIGFELWSVHANVLFDNIIVHRDVKEVLAYLGVTNGKRRELELQVVDVLKATSPKFAENQETQKLLSAKNTLYHELTSVVAAYPIVSGGIAAILLFALILMVKQARCMMFTTSACTQDNQPLSQETKHQKKTNSTETKSSQSTNEEESELTKTTKEPVTRKRTIQAVSKE